MKQCEVKHHSRAQWWSKMIQRLWMFKVNTKRCSCLIGWWKVGNTRIKSSLFHSLLPQHYSWIDLIDVNLYTSLRTFTIERNRVFPCPCNLNFVKRMIRKCLIRLLIYQIKHSHVKILQTLNSLWVQNTSKSSIKHHRLWRFILGNEVHIKRHYKIN